MAVVNVPHYEPWIVARWAFSELMRRLADDAEVTEDADAAIAAAALDGLHFHLMGAEQQCRLARRLSKVCDQYRLEITTADPRDKSGLAAALAILEMRLHDLFE